MDKVQKIRNYFPPLVIRISAIGSIAIFVILFFITNTAEMAHSDSDVEYRQESSISGTNAIMASTVVDQEYEASVISYSYEVDKVTPTPAPAIVADPVNEDVWIKLAQCESKQNWSIDTGNGYYGGLQFSLGAWSSVGGIGKPSDASKEEQVMRGKMLQQVRGWGPWGACSKKLGLI